VIANKQQKQHKNTPNTTTKHAEKPYNTPYIHLNPTAYRKTRNRNKQTKLYTHRTPHYTQKENTPNAKYKQTRPYRAQNIMAKT
jgi:hypothetical protein